MTPTPTPSPIFFQALSGDSAPWYGVPVIAGGFLILGAILGYFFNRANETRRMKREDKQRFDEKVLELSIDLVSTSQSMTLKARELSRHSLARDWPAASATRLEMSEMVRHMFSINGALFIIAPTPVSNHSQELVTRATKTFASEGVQIVPTAIKQNYALTDFVKVLRHSVGLDAKLQDRDVEPEIKTEETEEHGTSP